MTEPAQAPTADEPQPAPAVGDTSGQSAPQSAPPKPAPSPFDRGYGSGIAKGRNEGARGILESMGYSSVEEAVADRDAREAEEAKRTGQAAVELKRLQRELQQRDAHIKQLSTMADQARLDRLRAAALEHGIGTGKQLEAFVAMHGTCVQWGADQSLEVVTHDAGDAVPTGQSMGEWIDAIIADAPFLTAPKGTPGAGSHMEPASGPAPKPSDLFDVLGLKRG